jgi:hypothetical protein
MHSVSLRSVGYRGEVLIEASLSASPGADDWRVVHTFTFDHAPKTEGMTIKGKFVWLRIRYESHIPGLVDSAIVR